MLDLLQLLIQALGLHGRFQRDARARQFPAQRLPVRPQGGCDLIPDFATGHRTAPRRGQAGTLQDRGAARVRPGVRHLPDGLRGAPGCLEGASALES